MEPHTNRAAKHRYGKQRRETSDIGHTSNEKHELTHPKHVRYRTSNQRPPNSFHHENALLCELFINGTRKLRTQLHGSAWHSRHERPTTHIPAKEELPRMKAATIHPSKEGCQNTQKGDSQKKKTALLPPLFSHPTPHADRANRFCGSSRRTL